MAGDKSFHSFDELVQLLESRGVFIDDSTKTVLKRESYYAVVNGYKDPFLDSTATTAAGEDRYLNGTHFSEIHLLFLLDRQIRMALLPALLIAETTLKTLTVHTFCSRHPERGSYLDPANYRTDPSAARAVGRLIGALEKSLEAQGSAILRPSSSTTAPGTSMCRSGFSPTSLPSERCPSFTRH